MQNYVIMPNLIEIARGRDIAIFGFFKMAAAVILDFNNLKFLTVGHAKKDELLHCAKFRLNRSANI